MPGAMRWQVWRIVPLRSPFIVCLRPPAFTLRQMFFTEIVPKRSSACAVGGQENAHAVGGMTAKRRGARDYRVAE